MILSISCMRKVILTNMNTKLISTSQSSMSEILSKHTEQLKSASDKNAAQQLKNYDIEKNTVIR